MSWSYDSWIYNYLCNQSLSLLKLWIRTPFMAKYTRYNIIWESLSVTCDRSWFSPGTPVSSTNKTGRHDITEILLKVSPYWFDRKLNLASSNIILTSQYSWVNPLDHEEDGCENVMITQRYLHLRKEIIKGPTKWKSVSLLYTRTMVMSPTLMCVKIRRVWRY